MGGRGGGGAVPLEWQTGVVVSSLKKGDQLVRSNSHEITILGLSSEVYNRVPDRRLRLWNVR